MKSGILKIVALSMTLTPLVIHAADTSETSSPTWKIVKKPTNNFDTGESEPEGTGAKLRQDQQIGESAPSIPVTSSDTAAAPATPSPTPSSATTATDTASEPARMSYYEPGVTPPPRSAKKSKKTSASASKSTASSARTYARPPMDAYGSPSGIDTPTAAIDTAPAPLSLDAKSTWKIRSGERMTDVMSRWTKAIGWQLTWEPEDLVALADLEIEDTFTGATGKVIDALNRSGADMQAKFYAANKMLRITVRK